MLKIRWPQDRLILNMGIPVLVRQHLYIETVPWFCTHGRVILVVIPIVVNQQEK